MARTPVARTQDGAISVDFFLLVALSGILLVGIFGFGLMIGLNDTLTKAATEGARAGLSAPARAGAEIATAEQVARARLAWLGEGATVRAERTTCEADPTMECLVVTARYDYAAHPFLSWVPGLALLVPDEFNGRAVLETKHASSR